MEYILAVLEIFCNKTGMTFEEAIAWIEKSQSDESKAPWED